MKFLLILFGICMFLALAGLIAILINDLNDRK